MAKPKFLSDLIVAQHPLREGLWIITRPLLYKSDLYKTIIEVPPGYITDFASVPRIPVVYSLYGDRAHRESVIHDFLYQKHLVSKSRADRIFLEAMKSRGKPYHVRWTMYIAVVFFGSKSYQSGPDRYRILNDKN